MQFSSFNPPILFGTIRAGRSDFQVDEIQSNEFLGDGEHLWLHVQKKAANTQFVAQKIAEALSIDRRNVSYAGLKDRHAVTTQWFSAQIPGNASPENIDLGEGIEGLSHGRESWNLAAKDDTDAAAWAGMTAVTLGGAGVFGGVASLMMVGTISSSIPVAGWIAAAIIFTIAGLWSLFKTLNAKDKPIEIWASRTVFGKDVRSYFTGKLVYRPYNSLKEELDEYYQMTFAPIPMDGAKDILSKKARTGWWEHGTSNDEAKFTFLLPGFQNGVSEWSYKLDGYDGRGVKNDDDRDNDVVSEVDTVVELHESKEQDEGLYIYVSSRFKRFMTDSAGLEITYWPQGRDGTSVVKTLYVDD